MVLAACRQDMHDQMKIKPLTKSTVFADGRGSRDPVDDTVARGALHADRLFFEGTVLQQPAAAAPATSASAAVASSAAASASPSPVASVAPEASASAGSAVPGAPVEVASPVFPFPVTQEVMERGKSRFEIFCTPCHGGTGEGNGMVVQRGFKAPPSFMSDRLLESPPGYFFQVMTNGFGVMSGYKAQVPARDRWTIAAYIKALQMSQNASVADLTKEDLAKLDSSGGAK